MSENKIILDLKNDNRGAFNRLFRFYYPRIVSYIASLVDDDLIAEDIAQDVFLYVWENRKRLMIGKGFHSYLFQISYTRCLDHFRKFRLAETYNEKVFVEHVEQYKSLLDEDTNTLSSLYSKDFFEQLNELLDKIPADRKKVFVMAYIRGISTKEIAQSLNMPKRTVESHVYLTLKYLKSNMSRKDFLLLFMYTHLHFFN